MFLHWKNIAADYSVWPSTRLASLLFVLAIAANVAQMAGTADAAEPESAPVSQESRYVDIVKPLLHHKCYACHGALKQQGGLRLDTVSSMLKGGDSGPAIAPGDAANSLLLDVLTGDAGFQMPPAGDGVPLTDEEVKTIADWIQQGAQRPANEAPQTDPKAWWSYRHLRRPPLPLPPPGMPGEAGASIRNEIDTFIEAARRRQKLPNAVEADKSLWLRRVYLDLLGIPPTRVERERFLRDKSPTAYEKVVDDLLARPAYGERWGRHWMDVWRYSDWYGSRGINEIRYGQRHSWRWRDWIVASLNRDVGYDQMVSQMIAGDELYGADLEALAATGYLGRNWYKFDRDVWLFDTVERTGEAFLGVTFRCCRCHDHKYDPISQEEYYRFRAYFEPHDVRTDPISAGTKTQKDATLGQVLTDGLSLVYDKHLDRPTYRFERGDARYPDKSKPLSPGVPAALGDTAAINPVDLPVEVWYPMLRGPLRDSLVDQANADIESARRQRDITQEQAKVAKQHWLTAQQANAPSATPAQILLHDRFDKARPQDWEVVSGEWKHQDGKLIQSSVTSFATMVTKRKLPVDIRVHLRYRPLRPGTYRSIGFSFDYQDQGNSQDVYTSTADGKQSVQAFHRSKGKQEYPVAGIVPTRLAVEEEATLDVVITGSQLAIDLNGDRQLDYTLPLARREGRFSIWAHQATAEFLELRIEAIPESIETLAQRAETAAQAAEVAALKHSAAVAEAASIQARLAADLQKYDKRVGVPADGPFMAAGAAETAARIAQARLAVAEAGSEEQRKAAERELESAAAAAKQPTGTYSPLGDQFPASSTGRRAALARWLTSNQNPRTARVAVNHIWGRHMGVPLVTTPENFGLNGRAPSHPQLLDWLAAELVSQDWRMKPIHKKIVLSATYRMTSRAEFEQAAASENSSADLDIMKAAQRADPENRYYWRMRSRRMEAEVVRDATLLLSGSLDRQLGGPEFAESEGEASSRRSIYFRNTPNEKMPLLEVFDVADPNACYRRKESIVPHQALALMNSGLAIDASRRVARQLAGEKDFVVAAFETILSRPPTPEEKRHCDRFVIRHAELLGKAQGSAFSPGGTAKLAPATNPEARARENLVHVLLLHNDFVTIR